MSTAAASVPLPRALSSNQAINPWIIAVTVTLATFMELLDTAIANVSLPHIAGGLAVSYEESTWVLTSYLVAPLVCLLDMWIGISTLSEFFEIGILAQPVEGWVHQEYAG